MGVILNFMTVLILGTEPIPYVIRLKYWYLHLSKGCWLLVLAHRPTNGKDVAAADSDSESCFTPSFVKRRRCCRRPPLT